MLSLKYILFTRLFLKLGIFPFFSWYINVLYRFPTPILFLASTFHKLPPIFILYLTFESQYIVYILLFSLLTVLTSSIYILYILDLRYLIIVSSIGNNSFILLGVLTNSITLFIFLYVFYTFSIFLILKRFNNISSHSTASSRRQIIFPLYLFFILLNLGSFPPIPTFLSKFLIFFSCLEIYPDFYYILILIIVTNVVIIVSYIVVFFKYVINIYSNSSFLIIY
jgi:NADH:ubiquinone oxidoreductase subunit 2 (subunit N)